LFSIYVSPYNFTYLESLGGLLPQPRRSRDQHGNLLGSQLKPGSRRRALVVEEDLPNGHCRSTCSAQLTADRAAPMKKSLYRR
jgi:hypothetical protein